MSWRTRDLEAFMTTLAEGVVVAECDGSTHRGSAEASRWFADWHATPTGGHVLDWHILSFAYDAESEIATAQWSFRCRCFDKTAAFLGASVVSFLGDRIGRIDEYRTESLPDG